MRLLKIGAFFATLSLVFYAGSYLSARPLEQSKSYSFPESLGRHYAVATGQYEDGGGFGDGPSTVFRQTFNLVHPLSGRIENLDIETTAIDIEFVPSEGDLIEIDVSSSRLDPKNPVQVDDSRAGVLRIMTQEEPKSLTSRQTWINLDFGNNEDETKKRNTLVIKVPAGIKTAIARTVSGDTRVATVLTDFKFQSTSGDLEIDSQENPLARIQNLIVETVSGDILSPGRFDRLRFNSVSGDVRLSSLDRVLEIDGNSISGDFNIDAQDSIDATVEFITTSGGLSVDTRHTTEPRSAKKNEIFKIGNGTAKIKFQSVSGDLSFGADSAVEE